MKQKKAGGMKITFQAPPKNLDEKMLYNILRDYKMLNCEVLVRDENGKYFMLAQTESAADRVNSHGRRFHRCHHEGPQEVH